MAKVLSMEIGQGMTRVVEIDYRSKTPKIYNAFSIETPKDMVQDGVITRSEDFIVNLKSELRKRDIRTDSVVFTVASSRIANREARIPLCKEKEILPLITQNAADYFPVDMNQYHLVYNILGKTEEEGVKQYRLSLLAVPNDVTTSYLDLAHSLELHIKAMDYVGNSIFQAVRENMISGTNAVIKIDEHNSLITIVKEGEIVLQRSIPHGVNGAIENVTELDVYGENLTYADATVVFTQQRCLRRYLNVDVDYQEAEDTSDEVMMSRIMITENLRYFIGNIGRIIEYYVSRNENSPIDNIYLTGIGADFMGMDELLSNELGYNVTKYTGLDNIRIGSDKFSALESMRVYAAAVGASYAPLQLLAPELMKGEKQTSLALPIAVFVACVAVAITLFIIGKIGVAGAKSKNEQLRQDIKRNEVLESVNNTYKEAVQTYAAIDARLNVNTDNNRLLTQFISELEAKMPTGFRALKLSADASAGVSLDVTCNSKEEAAKVFQQIRTFTTVIAVSSSDFVESYEFTQEYLAYVRDKYQDNIDNEFTDEDLLNDGEILKDLTDAELEERREEKREEIASKYARELAYGRLLPLEEGQEDDGFPEDQIMEKTVTFSVVCIYNVSCSTNGEYMNGVQESLTKEQKERDEAAKEAQRLKEEAEKAKEEAEKAKQDAENGKNN